MEGKGSSFKNPMFGCISTSPLPERRGSQLPGGQITGLIGSNGIKRGREQPNVCVCWGGGGDNRTMTLYRLIPWVLVLLLITCKALVLYSLLILLMVSSILSVKILTVINEWCFLTRFNEFIMGKKHFFKKSKEGFFLKEDRKIEA